MKSDIEDRLKHGRDIAFLAAGATLALALLKGLVGYLFSSEILIADAFHSGADLLAVFASGFGLWLASKKKTVRFPYGLYKAETLISFIIGLLIIWAGAGILKQGYHRLFYSFSVQGFPTLPIGVAIFSLVLSYFIARKEKAVGRKINSQSLLANASESFLDILTSFIVLTGILLAYLNTPYIEGTIIILVSFLIFKLGLTNVWTSLLVLMDANLDPKLQIEIEKKINELYGVKGLSEVKIRQSGPFKMVECKIETSPLLSLYRAHELANKVENFISERYEYIESVFIHVEPSKEKIISAIIPVEDINGLESRVYDHFGRAPYYMILRLNDDNIEIEDFYYNEFLDEKKHIGVKVIKAVIKYKLDILFTSRIGEISFYMLKDNFVDIYKIGKGLSVSEIIKQYRNNRLEEISKPTHPIEESEAGK